MKLAAPFRVEMEITEKCNFNCKFCYNTWDERLSHMEFSKAKKIIDILENNGIFKVFYTGGEPLLNPDIFDIVEYAEGKISQGIYTNAYLLDEEKLSKLKSLNVKELIISLHSLENGILKNLTKSEINTNTILENIKKSVDMGFDVSVESILLKENLNEIPKIIKKVDSLGAKRFGLLRYIETEENNIRQPDSESIEKLLEEIKNKKIEIPVFLSCSFPYCAIENEELRKYTLPGCDAGKKWFVIDINGNVRYCPHSDMKEGNIIDEGLKDVYKSINKYKPPKICKKCKYFSKCKGGCRMSSYYKNNDINGKDSYFKGPIK